MRLIFFTIISFSYIFANAHIFVYHRFDDIRYPTADTTKQELIKQFEYFKTHNYKVVSLLDIVNKLDKKEPIPSNWIALTIDDAYKSFYTNGLKIFKRYNYPFSLYVYVEATNRHYGDYMSWNEIKETAKYGTIGLHSYSHQHLQSLTDKEIIKDTKKAYEIFVKHTGIYPLSYAYPYGEYDINVKKVLKNKFNFKTILNQSVGSINNKTDVYDMPRIALVGKVNIRHKLRYKTFDVKWIEPKIFPKDGILKNIYVKVNKKYKKLKLYITKYGWRDIKVNNGIVNIKLNLKLKKDRTRIIIGRDVFDIATITLNKTNKKEQKW